MKLLRSTIHPDILSLDELSIIQRLATRAIVLNGADILLLYTERYHDYTLPGGGLEAGEDKIEGMIRELQEETGAQNIRDIEPFGRYEEYRPWHKTNADVIHMISYCYTCKVDKTLGHTRFESHEINNGMKPIWINLEEAIEHNLSTIALSDKKGLSIERETFLLEMIFNQKKGKQN
ncbi:MULTISPECIES: NUDIX hydrolase [Vibrio]|uniref:NUDIX domain-containing protein n=1 Tax=Vibrio casei TaxID=673372 RepID=A0A368LI41_9VIBR|nr:MULTISPECIES: NUDIX hydrolase [Vibrio]RCS70296.1 NUDIX domain-containing protein [Vibrio casei]SJN19728.1 MutT/nudix family protein [Vibrio casei]HBV77373.1 NUDIX domain-containing protein [Vibrio sp.]